MMIRRHFLPLARSQFHRHHSTQNSNNRTTITTPFLTLYQYTLCPFCSKVRALLHYAKIDHTIVEVNPITKKELRWSNHTKKKVPIIKFYSYENLTQGSRVVHDSDEIIQQLLSHPVFSQHLKDKWNSGILTSNDNDTNKMDLPSFVDITARKWSNYATQQMAPILFPNICDTLRNSLDAFGYVKNVKAWNWWERGLIQLGGGVGMWLAGKKIKAKYNITNPCTSLQDSLKFFQTNALKNGDTKYCSGKDDPNMGDLAMFGVISASQNCPVHKEIFLLKGDGDLEVIRQWYDDMVEKCN